jgi:hypothetical protein
MWIPKEMDSKLTTNCLIRCIVAFIIFFPFFFFWGGGGLASLNDIVEEINDKLADIQEAIAVLVL